MWKSPKTNWKASDFFNVEDYNRIKGNLVELSGMLSAIWPSVALEDMGADKSYQDYSFYADEINRFERNLSRIRDGSIAIDIGAEKSFRDNQPFIGWMELNRIESACLTLYDNMKGGAEGRKLLAFTLNGGDF